MKPIDMKQESSATLIHDNDRACRAVKHEIQIHWCQFDKVVAIVSPSLRSGDPASTSLNMSKESEKDAQT